ncbi:arylsulfatase [Paenibacillus sp.]|uniref:arylsulfatase n=1 Tax=Paenibacillus sp. TaxID=58172 RepID=UPI002D3B855B|nr:arylsulfatase [Paenibacillus sp.]HZG84052.1 arylsulfatase [Paenibacillus sp.]
MGKEAFQGRIERTVETSIPWWSEKPDVSGKPNVVIVLLDDLGFAQLGCYGSDIATPNIDALARNGLRYNNFHTTALCTPSRAALLTGRHPHSVGMRSVLSADAGFPNARGRIAKDAALISEMLLENGYNTFAVGKWHLNTSVEHSFAGPFDNWPLGRGFEHYYGFLGGATSQWNPDLVEGNRRISKPTRAEDGYHITEDLTDKAIEYIREQKTAAPEKPFFCYLAYGAPHAPHHAPREFIEKYRGKYDKGWDKTREEWFENQKALGIIPQDAALPPRSPDVRAWDELTSDEQRLCARFQEAFAGFLEHTDYHIGRLIRYLTDIGQMDNTVFILLSDNGACSGGGDHGTFQLRADWSGAESFEEKLERIDEIGTPLANNHYPKGWAHAGNTPLRWYKSFVHAGGVRAPLIIHYPKKIRDSGGIRNQYHHVIDVMPTILELTGLRAPEVYQGVPQQPIHGVSMAYTFEQAEGASRRRTQIYEMQGNRAIYHDGWKAVSLHQPGRNFEEDRWELYHAERDFSELNDLAEEQPEKLQQLIDLWWTEAERYGFLPLEKRSMGAVIAELSAKSQSAAPVKRIFYRSESGLPIPKTPNVHNKHFAIEAEAVRTDGSEEGVLVAVGNRSGGYAFYIKDNRLVFAVNKGSKNYEYITSDEPLPAGKVTLRLEFVKTGELEGVGNLYCGYRPIGSGRLQGSFVPGMFGLFNIGKNEVSPVIPSYEIPFRFQGELKKVIYTLGAPEQDAKSMLKMELAAE